jgi:hypothetical protein
MSKVSFEAPRINLPTINLAAAKPAASKRVKAAPFDRAAFLASDAKAAKPAKAKKWQPHTARAMVYTALVKKLGLKVARKDDDERGLVMMIK